MECLYGAKYGQSAKYEFKESYRKPDFPNLSGFVFKKSHIAENYNL